MDLEKLLQIKVECLNLLLDLYKKANAGHIGSSLSCLDILIYIIFNEYSGDDKFILSKGHAAAALYVVMSKAGYISDDVLEAFYKDGTIFAAHPPCNRKINVIPFGTGSLGHGASLSCGIALASRYKEKKYRVFCVISEGDLNEGSTWEAFLFAAHKKLDNLYIIVDRNHLQGFGTSDDIIALESLDKKLKSFNFNVVCVDDGHSFEKILNGLNELHKLSNKPKCLIAQTIKGKGISFMENKMEWHYLPMSDVEYKIAKTEVGSNNA